MLDKHRNLNQRHDKNSRVCLFTSARRRVSLYYRKYLLFGSYILIYFSFRDVKLNKKKEKKEEEQIFAEISKIPYFKHRSKLYSVLRIIFLKI